MRPLLLLTIIISLFSCVGSSEEKAIDAIKSLEANKSFAKSDTLINSYVNFAEKFPSHKLAPTFLFKAAQACVQSNRGVKGAKLYEKMAMEYQNDTLAPEALIRAGVSMAAANDPANAKRLYDVFIKHYPDHKRIEEVKKWSEYSGLSEEELIRRFQENLNNLNDSAKLN